MIELTLSETLELQECSRTLHTTLQRLDQLGAGIAAIHVNAAIEQLSSNLEMIRRTGSDELKPAPFYISEGSQVAH